MKNSNFKLAKLELDDLTTDNFPLAYVSNHNRWNGWSQPYILQSDIERFVKAWNDSQGLEEGDDWSMAVEWSKHNPQFPHLGQAIGIKYIWDKEYAEANLDDGEYFEYSEVQTITLPNLDKVQAVWIGFGLIWTHEIVERTYDINPKSMTYGQRLTNCCGTKSILSSKSGYNYCENCHTYVDFGEGDSKQCLVLVGKYYAIKDGSGNVEYVQCVSVSSTLIDGTDIQRMTSFIGITRNCTQVEYSREVMEKECYEIKRVTKIQYSY